MNVQTLCTISQPYFDQIKAIDPRAVPVSDEIRKLCEQNMCGSFDKSWTCPPAIGPVDTLKQQIESYNRFMAFHKVYPLEDSFDWEGMIRSAKDFQKNILKLKKEIRAQAADLEFLALGAGACQLCKTCSYTTQDPCKNPDDAIFSLEAYGIDVMKMAAENGITYNNGKNTVTYIGGLFWNQTDPE